MFRCSPRTRGWTRLCPVWTRVNGLLPAHAGLDPAGAAGRPCPRTAPRARGVGPRTSTLRPDWSDCSPRTRGWTPDVHLLGQGPDLLPAHAGLDPPRRSHPPHPTPDSPRTRGWTQATEHFQAERTLFPAHAGMDPAESRATRKAPTTPRARGDGPDPCPRRGWSGCLFPGRSLHPRSLARRLTALGIEVRSARNSALLDYVRQLPPTVIGQLLGFSPTTMERWATLSGGKWARYSPSLPAPLAHRSPS